MHTDSMWGIEEFVTRAVQRRYIYDVPVLDGICGSRIRRGGKELLNFSAINFLGLQEEPEWLDKFSLNCRKYGLVTGGSRATQGISAAHWLLEEKMSAITGKARTLTFASGLLANIGFLNAMSARFAFSPDCYVDNRDAVFVLDQDSHWSLWKGAAHLAHGKQLFAFRHNDPADLEHLLRKIKSRKIVVVFESVYSADGSIAPVEDLLDACSRHEALSFVDDANGFMVYGYPNRPFHAEYQALSKATFRMVSFSKSIGLEGGAISGPLRLTEALEVLSGTSIFTAAIQPPTAATILDILNHLEGNADLLDGYLRRVESFRQRLLQLDFRLYDTRTYILSVIIGSDESAEHIRARMLDLGYSVPIFRYPAVKHNQAVMRLILSNHHTEEDLEGFVDALVRVRDQHRF